MRDKMYLQRQLKTHLLQGKIQFLGRSHTTQLIEGILLIGIDLA